MGIFRRNAPIASLSLVVTSAKTKIARSLFDSLKDLQNKKESTNQKISAFFGAGDGNRTHTTSLEGWDSSH